MTLLSRVPRTSRRALLLAPLGGFALVTAACGTAAYGSGSPASSGAAVGYIPPAASSAATDHAAPAAVTVKAVSSNLGTLLTDGQGKTLYLFEKDQPGMSACVGACLGAWPAFTTTGPAQAGAGVSPSLLTTIQRSDGTTEVTYNGHPLYYYAGDSNPGDTTGQGLNQFGASWYVVSPNGSKIDHD